MKRLFFISGLFLYISFLSFGFAVGDEFFDDIYDSGSFRESSKSEEKSESVKYVTVENPYQDAVSETSASETRMSSGERDVDEYNRRYVLSEYEDEGDSASLASNSVSSSPNEYTKRIVKYHDPEGLSISDVDQVNIYMNGEDDEDYYYDDSPVHFSLNLGFGWGGWYSPWYDPWFYTPGFYYSWYRPWYDPWYGPAWGWGPIYYPPYHPHHSFGYNYAPNGRRPNIVNSGRVNSNTGRVSSATSGRSSNVNSGRSAVSRSNSNSGRRSSSSRYDSNINTGRSSVGRVPSSSGRSSSSSGRNSYSTPLNSGRSGSSFSAPSGGRSSIGSVGRSSGGFSGGRSGGGGGRR